MTPPLLGRVTVEEVVLGLGHAHVGQQGAGAVDVVADRLLVDAVATQHHRTALGAGRIEKGQLIPRLIADVTLVLEQVAHAAHLLLNLVVLVLGVLAESDGGRGDKL